MNKKIINYIQTLSDNEKIQKLLIETIGKILLKQNNIEQYIKENEQKIIHIRDWISSVVENGEEWKKPRVLTLEALFNAADKYFEKKNNKLKKIELNENHEKLVVDLGDYYIVKMLTPEALDNESKQMQHCIGHGVYDQSLKDKNYKYLSLRDKFNNSHVTLEVKKDEIIQLQGKQNKVPEDKYLEILLPWLMKDNYKNIPWNKIGKFYEDNKWIEFYNIHFNKDIDYIEQHCFDFVIIQMLHMFSEDKIKFFFEDKIKYDNYFIMNFNKKQILSKIKNKNYNLNLLVFFLSFGYKNISLKDFNCVKNKTDHKIYSMYEMPDNCEIDGDLKFSNYKKDISLPNNLVVNGYLDARDTKIIKLPKYLKVRDSIYLYGCHIKELPNNLVVNGNLELTKCSKLNFLPKNLVVNGFLDIRHTKIEIIPDDIKILKQLYLNGCKYLKKLPDNLTCEIIFMDPEHIHLINNTMDIISIFINSTLYSKNDILKFKKY